MEKKGVIFLASMIFIFSSIIVSAETVILKSGKTVEGKILEKTDKYIKIDVEGTPITYFIDEIESSEGIKQSFPLEENSPSQRSGPSGQTRLADNTSYYVPEGYEIKIKIPRGWNLTNKTIKSDAFNLLAKDYKDRGAEPLVIFLKDSGDKECPAMICLGVRPTRPDITMAERLEHMIQVTSQDEKDGKSELIDRPGIIGNGKIIKYSEKNGKLNSYQYIFQKGEQLFYVFCDVCSNIINDDYKKIFDEIGSSIDSI